MCRRQKRLMTAAAPAPARARLKIIKKETPRPLHGRGWWSSRELGEVASRRELARWGVLGAHASGRATRKLSGAARGLHRVTWGFAAFCSVFVF